MKLFIFSILLANFCFAEVKEFPMSLGNIIVENESGNVFIKSDFSDKVVVNFEKVEWHEKCELSIKKIANNVFVKSKKISSFWSSLKQGKCKTNFVISAPQIIESEIKIGSGNLSVENMSGALEFKIGAGDVYINQVKSKSIVGKTGTGDIETKGDLSRVNFKVGTGQVVTKFNKVIGPGKFDVSIGTGNVSLAVPKTSLLKTKFLSGTGQLENNAMVSEDSPNLKVDVKSGTGNLKIKTL